jgi:predicted kinase
MRTDADGLVSLALAHLRRAQPRVVLVGGLPGTGKSTLAAGLQQVTGWPVVSSDHVRRAPPTEVAARVHPAGGPLYSAERVDDNYRTVVAEGRAQIRMGRTVILDATWSRGVWRAAAAAMAVSVEADLMSLCCVSDDRVAADRLRGRLSAVREGRATTESEATPEVSAELRSRWEPWPEATIIDASATAAEALAAALEALGWDGTD